MKLRGIFTAGILVLTLLATLWAQPPRPKPLTSVPHASVLLITVDTLRADHIGAYGEKLSTTPTIDALARDGILFERAYSQVPLTLASHTSLLTGTYPFYNGVQDFTGQPLGPDVRSIAQALKANGYETGAIVSSYVLDRSWGLDRGFDLYYDVFKGSSFLENDPGLVERKAGQSVDEALKWLRKPHTKPFFLWLHLYDPHSGYDPPEPFRTRFSESPYDGEIAYADSQLARVMTFLKQRGLFERMLIVFASDHGESLGEHGEKEHGFFVYHSTLHVPLIVKPPAASRIRPHRETEPVHIMAIAPTILSALELKDPIEKQFETGSLLAGKSDAGDPPVYSESFYSFSSFGWAPLRTINTSTYQYIDAPKPELYDVRNDPEETKNLITEQKATASVLAQKLKDLVARYAPQERSANTSQLSPEAVEKLRSLGYMAYRSPVSAEALAAGLADPKDKIWDFSAVLGAVDAGKRGNADSQRELLAQVQARNPEMYLIPFLFGEAQLQASDWASAEESLRRCLKLNPDFDQAMSALARALHQQNKDDEARQWVDKALQVNPKNLKAWYQKGWMNLGSNPQAAIDAFEKALEIQPSFAMAHRDLGIVLLQQQRFPEAADHLEKAAEFGLGQPRLYNSLGIAYSQSGRYSAAVGVYKKALAMEPGYAEAHLNLSYAYQKMKRPVEAQTEYQTACKLDAKLCQYRPENVQ